MKVVKCENCKDFIPRKDKHWLVGQCKSYNEGCLLHPQTSIQLKAFKARGNCEFEPCLLRFCEKFKDKNGE